MWVGFSAQSAMPMLSLRSRIEKESGMKSLKDELEELIAKHPVSRWRPHECREVEDRHGNVLRANFVFGVRID